MLQMSLSLLVISLSLLFMTAARCFFPSACSLLSKIHCTTTVSHLSLLWCIMQSHPAMNFRAAAHKLANTNFLDR